MKTWIEKKTEENPRFAVLLEEETLLLAASEILLEAMKKRSVTKSKLAAQLGKTKPFVTQLLDGGRNLTLRTMARVAHVLGFRIELHLVAIEQQQPDLERHVIALNGDRSCVPEETNTTFRVAGKAGSSAYNQLIEKFQPSAA